MKQYISILWIWKLLIFALMCVLSYNEVLISMACLDEISYINKLSIFIVRFPFKFIIFNVISVPITNLIYFSFYNNVIILNFKKKSLNILGK